MNRKTYGYIRVSSREQNEDRQRIAMREFGIPDELVFEDKQSGKDFESRQHMGAIEAPNMVRAISLEVVFNIATVLRSNIICII